jgi:tetratricopeptide (TPR) repeat protein
VQAPFHPAPGWVERPLRALRTAGPDAAIRVVEAADALLVRADVLREARRRWPAMPVRRSLAEVPVQVRRYTESNPSAADRVAQGARLEREGNWREAAGLYEQLAAEVPARSDLEHCAARARYHEGDRDRALELCRQVNARRPTADSLLLEARLHRHRDDDEAALALLQHAEQILSWKG